MAIWETVVEPSQDGRPPNRVVFYGVLLPQGYNHAKVDLHFRIEALYPDSQIDMVYAHPPIARKDGQPIGYLTDVPFDGKTWQQWSREVARKRTRGGRARTTSRPTSCSRSKWFEQEFRKR